MGKQDKEPLYRGQRPGAPGEDLCRGSYSQTLTQSPELSNQ